MCALLLNRNRAEAVQFIQSLPCQQELLWLSAYPTIFDARSFECLRARMSLSRSIDDLRREAEQEDYVPVCTRLRQELFASLIKDPSIGPQTQKIIYQLAFTGIKVLESSDSLQELILTESEEALQAIVGVEPVKDLLESLIRRDCLITFFAVAFRLHLLTAKTPFNSGLCEFVSAVAFPRLKALLKRALSKPFTAGPTAIRTLLTILADPFCAFGGDQLQVLSELFCQISAHLNEDCQELQKFYKSTSLVNQILLRPSKYPRILMAELMRLQ
jgi:hypothetical protein